MNKKLILILLIILISAIFIFTITDIENIKTGLDKANQNTTLGNIIWIKSGDMENVNFQTLKNANINTIFLNYGVFNTYDNQTVKQWIQTANNNGIKVHIWMQVLYDNQFQNPITNNQLNTNLLNKNIQEAKQYATIPGVSGIVLDYIRYPGTASETPDSDKAINSFVGNITENIKTVNPNILVSGTFMPEASRMQSDYGQDLTTLSENLDYVIPMMYKGNYEQSTYWIETTTKYFTENTQNAKVIVSLQTYQSDNNIELIPTNELNQDIAEAYIGGAENIAFFRYGLLDLNNLNTTIDLGITDILNIRLHSIL